MSSDESKKWFDECIDFDEDDTDDNSEKENHPMNPMKQPKTTKEQFKQIDVFMNVHDEELIDKETYALLWTDLAARLNDIGPPDHTVGEWKRIWSVHKHNIKRKRLINESDTEAASKIFRLEPSTSQSLAVPDVTILSEIKVQLSSIIENQSKMIANDNLIIQELKISNKLLQELVEKA